MQKSDDENMSNTDNIQRLREKRKSLEQAYAHSPKRKSGEPTDVSKAVTRAVSMIGAVDPDVNGNDSLSVLSVKPRTSNSSHDGKSRGPSNSNAFSTTVLEHVQFLEMKLKALEGLEKRVKGVEEKTKEVIKDQSPKYPTDSYSLIALNGPKPTLLWYELWAAHQSFAFWLFGMLVFLFQVALYGLIVFGETDSRWGTVASSGNPSSGFFASFTPPNTSGVVKVAQVVTLLVYVIFPDSTISDLLNAYRYFPRCRCSNQNDDPVWAMRYACILKGTQAALGIITTWFLVMTTDSVLDIILNFTAVNFISEIDDRAYSLAKDGVFGPALKEETSERIGDTKLPYSMQKKTSRVACMWLTSLGMVLFGFLIFVATSQENSSKWITQSFQLKLDDEAFKNYSGCFQLNPDSEHYNRYTYNNFDSKSSISYCSDDQKWILLSVTDDGNNIDPCNYSGLEIATSSDTDSFDISTSFADTWTSSGGTALSVEFKNPSDKYNICLTGSTAMSTGTDDANLGVRHLGDGICNEDLNIPDFQYDGGDCCAATCEGPRCGEKVLPEAFGKTNPSVAGFPNCNDPEQMVRVTMHLNGMGSNRRLLESSDSEKMEETPSPLFFTLRCDEKNVLTGYIEEAMVNNSETVMVQDGASCSLVVSDATNTEFVSPDPTWYVDYTLFHGDINDEKVMVLNNQNNQEEVVSFHLIPTCYFEELGAQIDAGTIYNTDSSSSSKAIAWLMADDAEVSQCGDEDFTERYTLVKMNFAMNESADLISREHHCEWQSISCTEGEVDTISLGYEDLAGDIPSDIGILTSLTRLDLRFNEFESVPSEIGLVPSLQLIDLDGNELTSVPTEIGLVTELEELLLSYNSIPSLPSEIGLMSRLKLLTLAGNKLSSLPTEIGLLKNVETLHLHGNQLLSIPSEIGLMSGLRTLSLNGNQLASVPTEIGLLTGLQELFLFDNAPLLSIPEEIKVLTSSYNLTLY